MTSGFKPLLLVLSFLFAPAIYWGALFFLGAEREHWLALSYDVVSVICYGSAAYLCVKEARLKQWPVLFILIGVCTAYPLLRNSLQGLTRVYDSVTGCYTIMREAGVLESKKADRRCGPLHGIQQTVANDEWVL